MFKCKSCLVPINRFANFIRFGDWIYITGLAFFGLFYASDMINLYDVGIIFLISSLYLAHGYTLNDYFDLGNSNRLVVSLSFLISNLAISFSYSRTVLLFVTCGALIGLLYSGRPFRMKRIIPLNFLLNSVGFSILFAIGFVSNKTISPDLWLLLIYMALALLPPQTVHLLAHRRDYEISKTRTILLIRFYQSSTLVLVIWAFLLRLFSIVPLLSFVTLIMALAQICTFKFGIREGIEFGKIRNWLRVLNVIFGGLIFLVLILK
jgi:4-hydroxybenzoate polyprenyltransferase